MKFLLVVLASTFVVLPAKANTETDFFKLLRLPGQCKGNVATSDLKFAFGGEQLILETEAGTIRTQMGVAKSKLELALQVRDRSGPDTFGRTMTELERQLQQNAEQRFEMDDAALAAGCLDLADKGYRELLQEYTRPADQAIRDRAKVGIDDVRAKR